MVFNFAAIVYIVALIADAFLIFFAIFYVIAFDELKTADDFGPGIESIVHKRNHPLTSPMPIDEGVSVKNHWSQKAVCCVSDLDYKNPIEQCASLNPLVLPEYVLHLAFNILFLIAGEWLSFFLNLPLILYHIYRYINRPIMSSAGLFDPTTIMNADVLNQCHRESWTKLAVYLLCFFYYLYGMIYSLIS